MENSDLLGQGVLVLFFIIFTVVLVWTLRQPASEMEAMSNLPLAADEHPRESRGASHG